MSKIKPIFGSKLITMKNELKLNHEELQQLESFIQELPTKFGMQLLQWLSSKVTTIEEPQEVTEE